MTTQLPSWYEGYEKILPASLDDLQGPADGRVALPFRLAWSGVAEYDRPGGAIGWPCTR